LGVSATASARWSPDFTDDDSVYIVSQFNSLVLDISLPPPSSYTAAPITLHPDFVGTSTGFQAASGAGRRPHTQPELVLSKRTGALSQKWVWDGKVLVPKLLDDPIGTLPTCAMSI
jgi:hypothetical protein